MRGCEQFGSNQVLQKTIDELRAITRIDLCVLSLEGQKVASTFSEEGFEPGICKRICEITGRQSGTAGVSFL